jgi:signal transduction histidine kinase/phage shock protein PspC (stress-responsive transcriptional regulator)
MVGGVCAGIADYFEVNPMLVRGMFLAFALATGFGFGLYPLGWALIPAAPPEDPDFQPTWHSRMSGWVAAFAFVVGAALVVLALRHSGLWLGDAIVLPLVLASCGVALILREAGNAGEPRPTGSVWQRWPGGVLGVILVLAAAVVFLNRTGTFDHTHHALAGFAVLLIAFGLVFGPWLVRLGRSLDTERAARIRSQERADVAAHLHDSVLQTLALIQRRADDPREVAGLARSQERELRRWLFERSADSGAATLNSALERAAGEIEALYKVRVEVVTVGDSDLDDQLQALVAAAREAMTNAAKFAGGGEIDLYSEVSAERIEVFVRDRGVGFDPGAIPDDRHGVRHSILERMRQHHGRAEIRSEPGVGTEVELTVDRTAR